MADYGKYALSGPFAAFLAEFVVEDDGGFETVPVLIHEACGAITRNLDDADALDAVLQAVIDHDCP